MKQLTDKLILFLLVAVLSPMAMAKTDVDKSMQTLKNNVDNSQANYEQYKTNVDITGNNIKETTDAIKKLRESRQQLVTGGQNVQKNKQLLDELKAKVDTYKKQEQERLKQEDAQIAELKAYLTKLESNKAARELNISAYQTRMDEIEKEKKDWDSQKDMVVQLMKEIDGKEKEALAERAKWIEKRKDYREEALKWHKANQLAEQNYTRMRSLEK